jgi:dUTP pyrophosphatase
MSLGNNLRCRGFEVVSDEFRKHPEIDIQLPKRSDSRSGGYDFYAPCDITLQPNEKVLLFSDVKAYMQDDEVLMLYVRSSIGIKKGLVLSNGTGIIDSSYYNNPSNDGNIGIALHNTTDKVVELKQGERVIQGIFMNYLVADNDNVIHENRVGGIGSSNR